VFGRKLLEKVPEPQIRQLFKDAGGKPALSENGLLRFLEVLPTPSGATLTRQAMLEQSKLTTSDFDLLCLFDAFECSAEQYSFRDLILAKKYCTLISSGTGWATIARSVAQSDAVASLSALSLHAPGNDAVYSRSGTRLSELSGQHLLPLDVEQDDELEDLFEQAAMAEENGDHIKAADLYRRCMTIDRRDAVAAFNRGNCLHAAGLIEQARQAQMIALKRDPKFVEAWFNLAGLDREQNNIAAARRHFGKAISIDAGYADAIYNLASLEYEAGELAAARRWWSRYLEIDSSSEWAQTASRGVQYADMQLGRKTAG